MKLVLCLPKLYQTGIVRTIFLHPLQSSFVKSSVHFEPEFTARSCCILHAIYNWIMGEPLNLSCQIRFTFIYMMLTCLSLMLYISYIAILSYCIQVILQSYIIRNCMYTSFRYTIQSCVLNTTDPTGKHIVYSQSYPDYLQIYLV